MAETNKIYGIFLTNLSRLFRIQKARISKMYGTRIEQSTPPAWIPEMLMPDGALFPTAWTVVGAADRVIATAKDISAPDDSSYIYNNHSGAPSDPIWFKLQDFSVPADGTYQTNFRLRIRKWNNGTALGNFVEDEGMGIAFRSFNIDATVPTTSFETYETTYGGDVVVTADKLINMRVVLQSWAMGVGDAIAISAINVWVKRIA